MKNKNLALVLTLSALILAGCGLQKMVKRYPEVSITLDNPDLENKGGKVDYTIKGTVPPKYMKKKAVVTVQPTIKRAMLVAIAAPRIPSRGNPRRPKIRRALSAAFSTTDEAP